MSTETIVPITFERTPNTLGRAYHAVLRQTNLSDLTLSEAMGYTALAFRLHIRCGSAQTDGIYAFNGGDWLERGFAILGFEPLLLRPYVRDITPEVLAELVAAIKDRLDAGFPVIGWDLLAKRFGVLYGYNEAGRVFRAADGETEGDIPYDRLHARKILCLGSVRGDGSSRTGPELWLSRSLEAIIAHVRGKDGLAFNNVASGLQAYDAWIEAFEAGTISHKGNALNVHYTADARRHAVSFLERLQGHPPERALSPLFGKAAEHYRTAAERLGELEAMYPYPMKRGGADPRDREHVPRSMELLRAAKQAEAAGAAVLEQILNRMNQ